MEANYKDEKKKEIIVYFAIVNACGLKPSIRSIGGSGTKQWEGKDATLFLDRTGFKPNWTNELLIQIV